MRKVLLGIVLVAMSGSSKLQLKSGIFLNRDTQTIIQTYYDTDDGFIIMENLQEGGEEEWMYAEYGGTAATMIPGTNTAYLLEKR